MLMEQATAVRKEWSSVCDSVIHDKPKFIKRTRDRMLLANIDTIEDLLREYYFSAQRYKEEDGTITLSLEQIDLVENGEDERKAKQKLGRAILEYATDYYNEYDFYSRIPNRKQHIPYVFKALIADNPDKIADMIQCKD